MIIAEDLLLLAYDDESGRNRVENLGYRLAGALLLELALNGRIEPTTTRVDLPNGTVARKGRIVVTDATQTGHPELDRALETIAAKPRKPADLIEPLAKGLEKRLRDGLVERSILTQVHDKVWGIFPLTRWPAGEASQEAALRARLESVLVLGATPTPHELALITMTKGTSLVKSLVPKEHRKAAVARANDLASKGWAADAVTSAIDEAVFAAVILPGIVASTVMIST